MAGKKTVYREPADKENPPKPVKGLGGRLDQHRVGARSGDQFCLYICDRFVLPMLTRRQIEEVAGGSLFLDDMTRIWIADHLCFRWTRTGDAPEARRIE